MTFVVVRVCVIEGPLQAGEQAGELTSYFRVQAHKSSTYTSEVLLPLKHSHRHPLDLLYCIFAPIYTYTIVIADVHNRARITLGLEISEDRYIIGQYLVPEH